MNRPVTVPTPGQMRACDPRLLARRNDRWRGELSVESLTRFASALVQADELVRWSARFREERGADGVACAWLELQFSVSASMPCGLCAEPMALPIDQTRQFAFAGNEGEAARQDELASDHDVLTADPRFDLLELIEDELILALPVHLQHETCPEQVIDSANGAPGLNDGDTDQPTQRPFADLLRQLEAAEGKNPGPLEDTGPGCKDQAASTGASQSPKQGRRR